MAFMAPVMAAMGGGGAAAAGGAAASGGIGSFLSSAAPALLGALAGAQGQQKKQTMDIAGPSATGIAGENAVMQNLSAFQNYVNAGPGQQDVEAGLKGQRDLAAMLQQFSQGGFLPGQSDWDTASQFSGRAFQPQQVALNQAFEGEQQRTAQLAAQMGRPVNDPILQAKLAQERSRGMERLGADRSAYEAQFAQQLPMQRLGFMGQMADVQSGLSQQAMANRQALVNIGSNLQQADQNFRLRSAGVNVQDGGGIGGAIAGGFAGYGAGLRNQAYGNQYGNTAPMMGAPTESLSAGGSTDLLMQRLGMSGAPKQAQTAFPGATPSYNASNFPAFAQGGFSPPSSIGSILNQASNVNFGWQPQPQVYSPNEQQVMNFWQQRQQVLGGNYGGFAGNY
jgi:hypothetical protein